jgi:hypothetical protein
MSPPLDTILGGPIVQLTPSLRAGVLTLIRIQLALFGPS